MYGVHFALLGIGLACCGGRPLRDVEAAPRQTTKVRVARPERTAPTEPAPVQDTALEELFATPGEPEKVAPGGPAEAPDYSWVRVPPCKAEAPDPAAAPDDRGGRVKAFAEKERLKKKLTEGTATVAERQRLRPMCAAFHDPCCMY